MARDSFYGERIVWSGRARRRESTPLVRALGLAALGVALISACFALILSFGVGVSASTSWIFSSWMLLLGLGCFIGPKLWLRGARYTVTDHHVIWQRGPFRRTIQRGAINFARVVWSSRHPGFGDLELVRAVPTGALRRRLVLRLNGLAAPDQVWAIIRGVETTIPGGVGERSLSQRLDPGEQVRWTARPRPSPLDYLPRGSRVLSEALLGLVLLGVFASGAWRSFTLTQNLREVGALGGFTLAALVLAQVLTLVIVLALAIFLLYHSSFQPGRLVSRTRYYVTDKRVLIQRGHEELHLDRTHIVDIIDSPSDASGLRDVFLVLDGPRARAVATSGAFGELESGPQLRPVLRSLSDIDGVKKALDETDLPNAA